MPHTSLPAEAIAEHPPWVAGLDAEWRRSVLAHARLLQWLLLAAALLAVGGTIVLFLYADRDATAQREGQRLAAQARVVEENLSRSLGATARVLDAIRDDLPALRRQAGAAELISRRLAVMSEAMPGVRTLVLMNAAGTAIASNQDRLLGQDFRDGARFQAARRGGDPAVLYVSPPFKTALGTYAVSVAKVILDGAGEFAGVLLAVLEPNYFTTLLDSVRYESGVWTSLGHVDGLIFVMVPRQGAVEGMDIAKPDSLFSQHRDSGQTATVLTGLVRATGRHSMVAQRTILPAGTKADKGLMVAVGHDVAAVYVWWAARAYASAGWFGLFVLFAVASLYLYQRRQVAIILLSESQQAERGKAESARRSLDDMEHRYRSLVENSASGIFLLRGEVIEYANPGLARMLGYGNVADMVGLNVFDILVPAFHGLVRVNLQTLSAEAGKALPSGRVRMQRQDGTIIDVAATAATINLDGVSFMQAEVRDITREIAALAEIRLLNAELEKRVAARTFALDQAVKQLEAANGNLESFSYSVAHDLRAPLRSMAGFSQLLEMDLDDGKFDDVKDHLRRIMESAAKMNALIDGLLHVAHAGHGKFAIERIDTGEMLEGVLNELGVRERAQVTVGQMPEVRADPAALRQVWVNLVSNAVKYSAKRHQQEISIACETQGSEFVFCVRDNGSGFNPDDAARLFGVFSRLHSARDYEGIGVGLAIVKRVVERHGGRVWAESKPDEGATFHFTIPVAPAA